MKKNKQLKLVLEMMSKIDPSYTGSDEGEDGLEREPMDVSREKEAEAYLDNDENDKDEPVELSAKEQYVPQKVDGAVFSKAMDAKREISDFSGYDMKVNRRTNYVNRANGAASEKEEEKEANTSFWSTVYSDTTQNLQAVASSDLDIGTGGIDLGLMFFKGIGRNKFGLFRKTGEIEPGFVPGSAMSGNKGKLALHHQFELLLDLLIKSNVVSNDIKTPKQLSDYLGLGQDKKTVPGILSALLANKEYCIKNGIDYDALLKLKKSLPANKDADFNSLGDDYRQDGVSNAQAKWFIDRSYSILTDGKTIKDLPSLVHVLTWIPKDFKKLRSVSYINSQKKFPKFQNSLNFRNFIFASNRIKYRTVYVASSGVDFKFNEVLDDPINDLSLEDLTREASYLITTAVDGNNKMSNRPGKDRTNWKSIMQSFLDTEDAEDGQSRKNRTSSTVAYSIMDYALSLSKILAQNSTGKSSSDSDIKYVFNEVLRRYFSMMSTVNGLVPEYDNQTVLSVIPMTAFFEDNDGVAYLNDLANNSSDETTRKIITALLDTIEKNCGGKKLLAYHLKKSDGEYRLFSKGKGGGYDIEEKDRISLFDLFSEVIVDSNDNKAQTKLLNNVIDFVDNLGLPNCSVSAEWNNDNAGNSDSSVRQYIGKKSIDISIPKPYGILIEYQGEQHYVPVNCKGIEPEALGLGEADMKIVKRSGGRASKYIRMSLPEGYELGIEKIASKINNNNCGKFLTVDNFSERMETLMDEIIFYAENVKGMDVKQIQRKEFTALAWEYLGLFVDGNVILDEIYDTQDTVIGTVSNESKNPAKSWGKITSLISRRRWKQELDVYLQQAADKQKFVKLKKDGYNFLCVCPSDKRITKQLIKEGSEVPFVTDFTTFMDGSRVKDASDYVDDDMFTNKQIAEGIYKSNGNWAPEYMASNFTYRFNGDSLAKTTWIAPDGAGIGEFGNKENLRDTILTLIKAKKGEA